MKEETDYWLKYANENIEAANLLLENNIYNVCLQNLQQAIEKLLKAILLEETDKIKKTHSIQELINLIRGLGINISISDAEIELIDSIYLPSKYPLGIALPHFQPNDEVCNQCLAICKRVEESVITTLNETQA